MVLNGGTLAGEFVFDQQGSGKEGKINQIAAAAKGGLAAVDQVRTYSSPAGGNEVDIHVTAGSKVTLDYDSDNAYYGYYDNVAPKAALGAPVSRTPPDSTITGLTFDTTVALGTTGTLQQGDAISAVVKADADGKLKSAVSGMDFLSPGGLASGHYLNCNHMAPQVHGAGTGVTTSANQDLWYVETGTTASSTAMNFYAVRPGMAGINNRSINWGTPIWLGFTAFSESNIPSGHFVAYMALGKTSSYTGPLTNDGIGVEIKFNTGSANQAQLCLEACSGSTLTESSTPYTVSFGTGGASVPIELFSNGSGQLFLYVNGVQEDELKSGAPTNGSSDGNIIAFDATNGPDPANYVLQSLPPVMVYK